MTDSERLAELTQDAKIFPAVPQANTKVADTVCAKQSVFCLSVTELLAAEVPPLVSCGCELFSFTAAHDDCCEKRGSG